MVAMIAGGWAGVVEASKHMKLDYSEFGYLEEEIVTSLFHDMIQ
jgi:hypothetical protein